MSIRPYRQDDFLEIVDIYNRSKLDELKFEDKQFTLLPLEKDKIRFDGLMNSDIYVFQIQEQVCGFGAISGNEISALFVHPNNRGKGIGKKLMEFLLPVIRGQAYLYVARTNKPAKDLYQLYGFGVINTFETTYNQIPVVAQKMIRRIPTQNSWGIN